MPHENDDQPSPEEQLAMEQTIKRLVAEGRMPTLEQFLAAMGKAHEALKNPAKE